MRHPNGGLAQSYRYDIIYMGSMEEPNICRCQVKGQPEFRGYQFGMRNPLTGAISNDNMSYDEDSCVFHRMATLGACILDPTRTVSLIPNILQG